MHSNLFLAALFGLNKGIQLSGFFAYPFRFLRNGVPTRLYNRGSAVVATKYYFDHKTNKSNSDFQIKEHKLTVDIKVVGNKLALVPYKIAHSLVHCNVLGNSLQSPKFSVKNIPDVW